MIVETINDGTFHRQQLADLETDETILTWANSGKYLMIHLSRDEKIAESLRRCKISPCQMLLTREGALCLRDKLTEWLERTA